MINPVHIYAIAICARRENGHIVMRADILQNCDTKEQALEKALDIARTVWRTDNNWSDHTAAVNGFLVYAQGA